ncbi:NAD nucleotidase [Thioflexithrix psekupsensis]|uniref:NAD nucleotidase n=1 Tax=Thioflexithrix psekupsensis TaxID=1570016 RepID=A0A251X9V3_9GAMM|nr:NAD nucleotidase [Thioflexithrix psekupsensis]OUD15030.1 NAD nucleotidase [Thioflexithrix psekupsensis]
MRKIFIFFNAFLALNLNFGMGAVTAEENCQIPYVDAQLNIHIPCYMAEDMALSVELLFKADNEKRAYWDLGQVSPATCTPTTSQCGTRLMEHGTNLLLHIPQLDVFGKTHHTQFTVALDAEHVNGGYFQLPELTYVAEDAIKSPLTLNLLHINDHHSHLVEENINLKFDGVTTQVNFAGFARMAAKIKELRSQVENPLVFHVGDAIVGTLYYSLFKGEADAAVMNAIDFDAMVLGNHEFDDGNAQLKTFLNQLQFPIVTANIDFSQSEDLNPSQLTRPIEPYLVKNINGQSVAIVGINTLKTLISSSPGKDLTFSDEIETAKRITAELEAKGINKIIYLTHYGYNQEQAMALQVAGIDVILGGDSHTLLGDFTEVGLTSEGSYPTIVSSPRQEPVCVAHAWQYGYVLGHLTVKFDDNGVVTECLGTPTLLLGDQFKQNGELVNEETWANIEQKIAQMPNVEIVTPDPEVSEILARYVEQVDVLSKQEIGEAKEDLLHIRIPGRHSSGIELAQGSLIAPLVAKGFFQQLASRQYNPDLVIQNAGGVRIDVVKGAITMQTAYTLLPFGNTIYLLEMSGAEVKQVLEEALINHFDNGGSSGSFPYAYGIRYTIDMNQAAGQRVTVLEVKNKATNEWQAIDLQATYRVGTNSFSASGGDGYLAFGRVPTEKRVDTFFDYAESFINYVKEVNTLSPIDDGGLTFIPKVD